MEKKQWKVLKQMEIGIKEQGFIGSTLELEAIVSSHNSIIATIMQQNARIDRQLCCLNENFNILKKKLKQKPDETETGASRDINCNETEKKYKYELRMLTQLDTPAKKGRKFDLNFELTDDQGNRVFNENPLVFSLAAETSEGGKLQTANIVKYSLQSRLMEGTGCIRNIQPLEVTSHFPKGYIKVNVRVSCQNVQAKGKGECVKPQEIAPFQIPRLIIRSKQQ